MSQRINIFLLPIICVFAFAQVSTGACLADVADDDRHASSEMFAAHYDPLSDQNGDECSLGVASRKGTLPIWSERTFSKFFEILPVAKTTISNAKYYILSQCLRFLTASDDKIASFRARILPSVQLLI